MALPATGIIEVESGGVDASNGGMFDPGNASMATDGAATLGNTGAPVFTSASYNFVAGDVGHWLFLKSGASCVPGWYKIASVAANAATLDAAVGHVPLYISGNVKGFNTIVGCETIAGPGKITWTMDYSQTTAPRYSYTDLTAIGAGSTFTSTAAPFGKNFVGNSIQTTAGANVVLGVFNCISTSGTTATFDRAVTTGATAGGTGGGGGAFASPGKAGSIKVAGNDVFIKTGVYTITSTSANVAGGTVSDTTGGVDYTNSSHWEGYTAFRGDRVQTTRPTLKLNTALGAGLTIFANSGASTILEGLIFDGNSNATSTGMSVTSASTRVTRCSALNCTTIGLSMTVATASMSRCDATLCSGTAGISGGGKVFFCESHANTCDGFVVGVNGTTFAYCSAYANTGGTSSGFNCGGFNPNYLFCNSYGNGQYGFNLTGTSVIMTLIGNISYANTSAEYKEDGIKDGTGGYYNAGTLSTPANFPNMENQITLSGDPFVSGATGNFVLNSNPGAGAAIAGIAFTFPSALTVGSLTLGAAGGSGGIAGLSWPVGTPKGRAP